MNIKAKRKELNISQSELAELTGIKLRTLQEYEQNRRDVKQASAESVYEISKALGIRIEDVLEREYLKCP